MRKPKLRNKERGMSLLIALLALLLISAIGMGMLYMAGNETGVNSTYKDSQVAFFSMRGGLEEMRDRMRSSAPSPITLPTVMPGTANSIIYIINPSGGSDTVDPKTYGNTYFDDEFCHESFVGSGVTYQPSATACNAAGAPPSASVATYVNSISPFTNTSSSVKYKWVRLTEKQNGTFPNNLVAPVDASHTLASAVCWNSSLANEVLASALGYPDCVTAAAAGIMVEPVYLVTSLAITPQGSRRIGQYETAAISITPPGQGVGLGGPAANFGPPNSANGTIDGVNGSGPSPPALAGCNPTSPVSVPAIGAYDSADAASIAAAIPSGRTGNYPGDTPSPSVVDMGSDAGGTNQLTNWSTPAQLNALVAEMANGADATYNCSINGVTNAGATSACSGTYGTDANPQITFINGDVSLSGGAGVIVITGTVTISGVMEFDGLVLVIGQGAVTVHGGGNGAIYGSMFVAQTNSATAPFAQLATIGSPSLNWNGGGKAGIYYNSCWANVGNGLHYKVVASREEMY